MAERRDFDDNDFPINHQDWPRPTFGEHVRQAQADDRLEAGIRRAVAETVQQYRRDSVYYEPPSSFVAPGWAVRLSRRLITSAAGRKVVFD
ncbi:MAG TPA: hypothetical protein VG753_02310 [Candidatus Paceibacterota bacterium]|nr:hypothetical protein [Candidatus Paceibacterota bacterium]